MEMHAPEALEARYGRDRWLGKPAHSRHQDPGGQRAIPCLDPPLLRVVAPRRRRHGVVETNVGHDPEPPGAVPQIVPDLLLHGERPAPVRVGGEGEGVEMRRHVALATGVGIVAPRAPQVGRAFQDHEIAHPRLFQADRHPEPGEPGTDDGDVEVLLGCPTVPAWAHPGRLSYQLLRHVVGSPQSLHTPPSEGKYDMKPCSMQSRNDQASAASSSIRRPSWKTPSAPRSYCRIIPTGRNPTDW